MDYKIDPYPSQETSDPLLRLAAGVVLQAGQDLRAGDPVRALDAMAWILSGDISMFLDVLGIHAAPGELLGVLAERRRAIRCDKVRA